MLKWLSSALSEASGRAAGVAKASGNYQTAVRHGPTTRRRHAGGEFGTAPHASTETIAGPAVCVSWESVQNEGLFKMSICRLLMTMIDGQDATGTVRVMMHSPSRLPNSTNKTQFFLSFGGPLLAREKRSADDGRTRNKKGERGVFSRGV